MIPVFERISFAKCARGFFVLVAMSVTGASWSCVKQDEGVRLAHVEAPSGGEGTVCLPSGPELCFNATDDNCNGVIDEGCGVPTGLLQWTIAWQDREADVDLAVTTPSHSRASASSKTVGALAEGALRFDRDCPPCQEQNTENVYLGAGGTPEPGEYIVEVTLVDAHGTGDPIEVRLGARVGSKVTHHVLFVSPADSRKVLRFRVNGSPASH